MYDDVGFFCHILLEISKIRRVHVCVKNYFFVPVRYGVCRCSTLFFLSRAVYCSYARHSRPRACSSSPGSSWSSSRQAPVPPRMGAGPPGDAFSVQLYPAHTGIRERIRHYPDCHDITNDEQEERSPFSAIKRTTPRDRAIATQLSPSSKLVCSRIHTISSIIAPTSNCRPDSTEARVNGHTLDR